MGRLSQSFYLKNMFRLKLWLFHQNDMRKYKLIYERSPNIILK